MLKSELIGLSAEGEALGGLAISEAMLVNIGAITANPLVNGERPTKKTSAGEVWRLGKHRIIVGEVDEKIRKKAFSPPANFMVTELTATTMTRIDDFRGDIAYIFYVGAIGGKIQKACAELEYETKYQIIWNSPNETTDHSSALMVVKSDVQIMKSWRGERKQHTVWSPILDPEVGVAPIEARRRAITNHLKKDEIVFDPNPSKKGETLLACEYENRIAHIVAPTPEIADLIIARWEKVSGKGARHIKPKPPSAKKKKSTKASSNE